MEENHKTTLSYNNQFPARDSNCTRPKYKSKALLLQFTYSVVQYKQEVWQGTALATTIFHSAYRTE
jgi:hypothetical protein